MRYFEDFRTGETVDLGEVQVREEDILEFAHQFDPQPIHVDAAAARASIYGGLIASGWHTASLFMRLFATTVLNQAASLGSPGVEELRWLRPVRPGDVLRGRYEVLEVTPSRSTAGRGTVRGRGEMLNQHGEVALRLAARNLFACRPAGGS